MDHPNLIWKIPSVLKGLSSFGLCIIPTWNSDLVVKVIGLET